MSAVLDASVVLAVIFSEPGSDRVGRYGPDVMISAVNMAEVASRLVDRRISTDVVTQCLVQLGARTVPFDTEQALLAGALREPTKKLGLSMGDRACLALAMREGAVVVTADKAWKKLALDVEIELIR